MILNAPGKISIMVGGKDIRGMVEKASRTFARRCGYAHRLLRTRGRLESGEDNGGGGETPGGNNGGGELEGRDHGFHGFNGLRDW
jgi:hypothetical protein